MAGHSKWANIKHRKAAQDAKRGKLFTKLIRELVVAARAGGAAVEDNPRLRAAVDKALGANMKRDTIDNAIDGQVNVVQSSQQRVAEARTAWQACERKRMSYDTLATRARDQEMRKENKRDQKSMDEHAARISFYKR